MKEFDQMMQNEGPDQMVYTDGERQRFAYIGKWLGRLFWLMILCNIPALATEKWVHQNIPPLYWMGHALTLVSLMGIGVILLMLSREEKRYRAAGICQLIAGAASWALNILEGVEMNEDWTLLISLPGLVVALIALYQRLMAHADLLRDLAPTLCCKWRKLWTWNLVTCVCEIILAMLSVFSAIVLIALDGNLVWTAVVVHRSADCDNRINCLHNCGVCLSLPFCQAVPKSERGRSGGLRKSSFFTRLCSVWNRG